MNAVHFKGVTHIYKGNDLQPGDLPVKRTAEFAISRWQPTIAELRALNEGGSVELAIAGCQPAIAVRVV